MQNFSFGGNAPVPPAGTYLPRKSCSSLIYFALQSNFYTIMGAYVESWKQLPLFFFHGRFGQARLSKAGL